MLQDEILTVIRRIDSNWAEGKLGDKIGIFPISFVEVRVGFSGVGWMDGDGANKEGEGAHWAGGGGWRGVGRF